MNGFLWSGLDFFDWFLVVVAQTTVGFLLIAAFLTPSWAWLKNQLNPFTLGGAGSRTIAGREVHEILSEVEGERK